MSTIQTKRVYDSPDPRDGARFLVDRLWPRGLKKEALELTGWPKQLAPSERLRRWFGHDAKKWEEFQRHYFRELEEKAGAWQPVLDAAARQGRVTLLFAARDQDHNNAVALKTFLESKLDHDSRRLFNARPLRKAG